MSYLEVIGCDLPKVGLDGMICGGREQWRKCGCRAVQVAMTSSRRVAVALGSFCSPPAVQEQALIQCVRSSPKLHKRR